MSTRLSLFVLILLCATTLSAHAHKVNIFAYVEGDFIHTQSGFSKSRRVQGGTVSVIDAASKDVLLTGTTDKNGDLSFAIPQRARDERLDLLLVLDATQGHRAEWLVRYSEFGNEEPVSAPPVETPASTDGVKSVESDRNLEIVIERVVKKAVVEETASLRKMIAQLRDDEPGLREVVAGFGYLMGVVGIVAYMRSRQK